MSKTALLIKHRALVGKRDEVRRLWEKHVQPRVAANPAHEFYFYCYADNEPDTIYVFQQYTDRASAEDFLKGFWYSDYLAEVTPLLAAAPEIRSATPVWVKGQQ
jgi:quinol monooxygenase YgiN